MKAIVFQPPYSMDPTKEEDCFQTRIKWLKECDESADMIVLPEYSDVCCATETREQTLLFHAKHIGQLLDTASETARRCQAVVFVNALSETGGRYRNTTFAFDKEGSVAGKYYKRHLPPSEKKVLKLEDPSRDSFAEPFILDLYGIRYAFMTCYDFYFYEAFSVLARKKVDIIIGCSLQRSDTPAASEIISRFLAYNCNAYVLRSSVSLSENSPVCGGSIIVAPDGTVLAQIKSKAGKAIAEFDPKKKYLKPAGFGNPDAPHYEYIERGRRPWLYRPSGPAMVPSVKEQPYPRVCAHRGFSTVAPENSMAAFGAAVALGAKEIEFDLWPTADGEIVSIHDRNLKRVSNGQGLVDGKKWEELKDLDFGVNFGEDFSNLHIVRFEDILKKFSRQVIMNIHIKTIDDETDYDPANLEKIINLIDLYDCRDHVYFMTSNDKLLRLCAQMAPDIGRCCGESDRHWTIVDRAIENRCQKVQLFKPYFNQAMIDKAHEHGIICNVFWSDDPQEAAAFLDMGIDCILTNDYQRVVSSLIRDGRIDE